MEKSQNVLPGIELETLGLTQHSVLLPPFPITTNFPLKGSVCKGCYRKYIAPGSASLKMKRE